MTSGHVTLARPAEVRRLGRAARAGQSDTVGFSWEPTKEYVRCRTRLARREDENPSGLGRQADIVAETHQKKPAAMHTSHGAELRKFATLVLSACTSSAWGHLRHVVTLPRKMFAETDREVNRSVPASACWSVSEARRLTMKNEHVSAIEKPSGRIPWNKGKQIGRAHV